MRFWERLTRKYTRQRRDGQYVLSRAYQEVFRGSPDRNQQQMVLADLAAATGFYRVSPASANSTELAYREGQRAAFAHIFGHLSLSPDDMGALENAARHEALDIDRQDYQ